MRRINGVRTSRATESAALCNLSRIFTVAAYTTLHMSMTCYSSKASFRVSREECVPQASSALSA